MADVRQVQLEFSQPDSKTYSKATNDKSPHHPITHTVNNKPLRGDEKYTRPAWTTGTSGYSNYIIKKYWHIIGMHLQCRDTLMCANEKHKCEDVLENT